MKLSRKAKLFIITLAIAVLPALACGEVPCTDGNLNACPTEYGQVSLGVNGDALGIAGAIDKAAKGEWGK